MDNETRGREWAKRNSRKPIAVARSRAGGWIGADGFNLPPDGWMWVEDLEWEIAERHGHYIPESLVLAMPGHTPRGDRNKAAAVFPSEAEAFAALGAVVPEECG